jgi:hypothetical protein
VGPDRRDAAAASPSIIAYYTGGPPAPKLVPAPVGREWMQATFAHYAQRCLPMLIANQAGWWILNRTAFNATWDGENAPANVTIAPSRNGEIVEGVASLFGYGILSLSFPFLFRTSPGYNLLVRGPANRPRHGIFALEGIVETDWAVASFTMNWQFAAKGTVEFAADEPLCMIVPQRRGELESFRAEVRDIGSDSDVAAQHKVWDDQRQLHALLKRAAVKIAGPDHPDARSWEGEYFRGTSPGGSSATEHQTRLILRPFEDLRPNEADVRP